MDAILGIQNAPDVAAKNLDTRDRVKIYISSGGQGRRVERRYLKWTPS